MDKPNYVLLNNNKPAECFIEQIKANAVKYPWDAECQWSTPETDIKYVEKFIESTKKSTRLKTIALFKIRLK